MLIYDSLQREKVELKTKSMGLVNIYLCGPTVYDHAHLGHARSALSFDLLSRVLKALGFRVRMARNYTDIDDKILKKMQESKKSIDEITAFYTQSYEEDMQALNVLEPSYKPCARSYIKPMIELISRLLAKGFAYEEEDGIYLDSSKDELYLSLSKKPKEALAQSRLQSPEQKRSAHDFVLWKFDKDYWQAPFGAGRPGWHTECVVMIDEIFGEDLDIHAGGADLFFPHHENEACQCRLDKNKELASYWMHNGFVNIKDEKMSKSLGNSLFVKDILKTHHAQALRLYLLSTHYRSSFAFFEEDLVASKKKLDSIYRAKEKLQFATNTATFKKNFYAEFLESLSDDLNISKALAILEDLITVINKEEPRVYLKDELNSICAVLGIGESDINEYFQDISLDDREEIELLIKKRLEARNNKDFKKADEIRDILKDKGIAIRDIKEENTIKTIWEKL